MNGDGAEATEAAEASAATEPDAAESVAVELETNGDGSADRSRRRRRPPPRARRRFGGLGGRGRIRPDVRVDRGLRPQGVTVLRASDLRYNPAARGHCPRFPRQKASSMSYAIISVGGKQYRVREGERLLVDRLALDDGASFTPAVLLAGGSGDPQIAPADVVVTATVLSQEKGPKIRIGKYKKRTGYKRHTGFRSSLTRIQHRVDRRRGIEGRAREAEAEGDARAGRCARRGTVRAAGGLRGPHGRADQGGRVVVGRGRCRCCARLRAGARQAQGRHRRSRGRDRRGGELDGTQEGARLLQERPRLTRASGSE